MTSVIHQRDRQIQRSCNHDHKTFVRYLCHDSREQIRRACLDCGRPMDGPFRYSDHPRSATYPQLVQRDDDRPLTPHRQWQPVDYDEYLASDQWRERREYFAQRALNRCQVCNASGGPGGRGLNLHHRTYARLGCEFDTDVVVLCRDCHELYHRHQRLAAA